jgi:anti-anti-sigma factor
MVCALVVGAALVFLTGFLKFLPKVVLSAIVLISIVKLVDYEEAIFLYRVSTRDFVVFCIIFLSTLFLPVTWALLVGILFNWVMYLSNSKKASVSVLGRRQGDSSGSHVDVLQNGIADSEQHIVVLKLFDDMSFANAPTIRSTIEAIVGSIEDTRVVVADCSAVTLIDGSGLHALSGITADLVSVGSRIILAALPRHCHQTLELAVKHRHELTAGVGRWDVTTRADAVAAHVEAEGAALMCFATVEGGVAHARAIANQVGVSTTSIK